MKTEELCAAARIEAGEHPCQLQLQPRDELPGGLWSWRVYVNGDIHHRGPGSTRTDPNPSYAVLFKGQHRVVIRAPLTRGALALESNTLAFAVADQDVVTIDVFWRDGRPYLELQGNVAESHG